MIFDDKSVLITGGTGSLGKTLVGRLAGADQNLAAPQRALLGLAGEEFKQA
jgi:FlaA1/EpsC-like NDP-sugar epimerase